MRVAFNAQLLSLGLGYRSAGISQYIDRTLAHLGRIISDEQLAVCVGADVPIDAPSLAGMQVIRTRLPTGRPIVRILWEQLVLPTILARWRADLLHAPAYVAPLASPCPAVVTYHDLSFYLMPEAFNRQNRWYLQTFSRYTARRARQFIAVSDWTRQDLIRRLGVSPACITVVHNGVDSCFRPESDAQKVERFRREKGLPERFILYLGTLEPRKNLPALLRGYAEARRRGVVEPLILAGGRGWGVEPILQALDDLNLRSTVRLEGFVRSDERALWYNAATLFAYPSRYEGFGLPVAEAMACGTPVVSSNRSSLPEVVGDAGVQVDPDDSSAMADALTTLLRDDDRLWDLSRRGLDRSRRFTWDAAARATLRVYQTAMAVPQTTLPDVGRD